MAITVKEIHETLVEACEEVRNIVTQKTEVLDGSYHYKAIHPLLLVHLVDNPNDKFIPRTKLKDICIKYGLKIAPAFAFEGVLPKINDWEAVGGEFQNIPTENAIEVCDFKLHKYLHDWKPYSYQEPKDRSGIMPSKYLVDFWRKRNTSININTQRSNIDTDTMYGDVSVSLQLNSIIDTQKFLLHLGEGFALEFVYDDEALKRSKAFAKNMNLESCMTYNTCDYYDVFLIKEEKDQYGQPLVYRKNISNRIGPSVLKQYTQEFSVGSFFMDMRVSDDTYIIDVVLDSFIIASECWLYEQNQNNMKLGSFTPMVVASDQYFKYLESFELKDGWEYSLPRRIEMKGSGGFGAPDPIYLQPVMGGYLVVTMWGDEEEIIENEI